MRVGVSRIWIVKSKSLHGLSGEWFSMFSFLNALTHHLPGQLAGNSTHAEVTPMKVIDLASQVLP